MADFNVTTPSVPASITNFSGGLNSAAAGLNVRDNEASDLQNIDFDVFGSFRKRNGYETLNSSAFNSGATNTGLFQYLGSTGTDKLVGVFGDTIARMDDLDGTWDDITGGLTVTAGNNNLVSFSQLNDIMIGTNNVDAPFQWNGSGNASAAGIPTGLTRAHFTAVWNNFAFYADVTISGTLHPTRLYWSNFQDPGTWTSTDFANINRNDGQAITGIFPLGDRLVIFKERSIWLAFFTGDSDIPFVFQPSVSNVGCASGYSIQEVQNGLVFLSQDGIYFFDGNNSLKLSDRINTTLLGFARNRFQFASSAYLKSQNRYYLSFTTSGGTEHNRVIIWDSINNAFSVYVGYNANAFTILFTSGEERIYFGDYAGFSYRADTGLNDNPEGTMTAIDAFFKTKWFEYGDILTTKGILHATIFHRISTAMLTFGYGFDFDDGDQFQDLIFIGTSAAVYGSAVYDLDTYAREGGDVIRRDLSGRGRVIRFTFSNSNLNETFQIDGLGMSPHVETAA